MNETECIDCQDAQALGYTVCGDCSVPVERWEVTTPEDVYWNGED